jgi:hypothetical protein
MEFVRNQNYVRLLGYFSNGTTPDYGGGTVSLDIMQIKIS